MRDLPELLTIKEAAALLRCSPRTIQRLWASGELVRIRVGKSACTTTASVARLVVERISSSGNQ